MSMDDMQDPSRRYDIKPDPDMVSRGTDLAVRCSNAINVFHTKMGWQLGVDGSHGSSYRALLDLAETLEDTCKALRQAASDGDERATSKFRS